MAGGAERDAQRHQRQAGAPVDGRRPGGQADDVGVVAADPQRPHPGGQQQADDHAEDDLPGQSARAGNGDPGGEGERRR